MSTATLTSILVALVGGLILALGTIVWFAVTRWIQHVDGLQVSIEGLRAAISAWESKFVTTTQHEKDIASLRRESALGRRVMDHCSAPDCPFERAHPECMPTEPG